MKHTPKRLSPTKDVLRALFAKSSNQCAFPGCSTRLIDEDNNFVAQICHIEAASKGGQRFNESQTDEERRDYKNLLLLCYPHHIKTNNVTVYTVDVLRRIKVDHESSSGHFDAPNSTIDQVYNDLLRIFNERLDNIGRGIQIIEEKNDDHFEELKSLISQITPSPVENKGLVEIETIKQLRRQNRQIAALHIIENIKQLQWSSLSKKNKYLVLVNEALLKADLHRMSEASANLIEALEINPDDEQALAFASWGYVIQGNLEEASKVIELTLKKNPKNANAYNSFIQVHEKMGFQWLKPKIPPDLLGVPEITFNLALVARRDKEFDDAIEMLQAAIDNAKNESAVYFGPLGSTIVESITQNLFQFTTEQISYETKSKAKYAIELLDKAWKLYERTDVEKHYCWILVNRSIAKKMIGDFDGAYDDVMIAATISPDDVYVTKHLALMHLQQDNYEKALQESERLIIFDQNEDKLGSVMIKVEALQCLERHEDSLKILLPLYGRSMSPADQKIIRHYIVKAYSRLGDVANAAEFLDNLLREKPNEISAHNEAAFFWLSQKNYEKCDQHLNTAYELSSNSLNETRINEDLYELGNLLFATKQFGKSASVFKEVIDSNVYSKTSRKLILALFNAGEKKHTLEICIQLERNYGIDQFLSEALSTIYESVDDLENAIAVNERYLQINPDDQIILIRQAFIFERQAENAKVLQTLNRIYHIDYTLPHPHLYRLAHLYYKSGQKEKGLSIAYETRRKNYDIGKSHVQYFGLITELKPNKVEIERVTTDCAVRLTDNNGTVLTYILETNGPHAHRNELAPDDQLARLFIGKKIGEKITIDKNFTGQPVYEIVQIQAKYEYAYQQTIDLFQTTFINEPEIVAIKFGDGDTPNEKLRPIFEILDKEETVEQQLYEYYRAGKAPIGLIASIRNLNPIRAFYILALDPANGILPVWHINELADVRDVIDSGASIVLDITSLTTFAALKKLSILQKLPNPKVVAQSTFEVISSLIRELNISSDGQITIGKVAGEYVRHDMTSDQIKSNIEHYTRLQEWIKAHCAIKPPLEILNIDPRRVEERERLFGASFHDTILIAQELKAVLLSEDNVFRQVAFSEHKVKGIPTFLLLYYLKARNLITPSEHTEFAVDLFDFNFKGIPCDLSMLLEGVRRSKFKLDNPLDKIIDGITSPFLDEKLSSAVAIGLIFELYTNASIIGENASLEETDLRRKEIANAVLQALFCRPVNLRVLAEVFAIRFFFHEKERDEVAMIVDEFLKNNG